MINKLKSFLYPQQVDAVNKIVAAKGGAAFWKVGKGKTRIGLAAAADLVTFDFADERAATCLENKAIGIIARRAAFDDWRNEIATLQLKYEVEEIENVDASKALQSDTFILISAGKLLSQITVATLQRLVRFQQMKCLIIDEGWLFTNPKSIRHRAVSTVCTKIPTIVLSGTLMPSRDLTQVYGQLAAAGKGKQVAKNLTAFRSEFQIGIDQGGYTSYYPKPGAYAALMERIAPFTHAYFPHENEGAVVSSILKVKPTSAQQSYFTELRETYAVEGVVEFNSAGVLIQKIQQVSNGWLKGEGDRIISFPSTKVDRCKALVEEIIAGGNKVVVWCAFRHDIVRLMDVLQTHNCNVATFQGGEPFDIKGWNNNEYDICLATEASGSSVNHFAQVPYGIYFSQDWKWRNMEQSQGRHTRKSSRHSRTYFYFLHTDKSMDARVHFTVKTSASSERSFIKALDVNQWLKG